MVLQGPENGQLIEQNLECLSVIGRLKIHSLNILLKKQLEMLLVHIYVFTTPPDGLILVYTSHPRRKVEMAPGSAHATLRGLAE